MQFYMRILEAAAVEHSTRYQLMEEASQNAGRMIEEMTEVTQMYRREAITQEMQELASGAGLLGGR
jgi:F0F1-type ATP synthase gamma subunit